MIRGTPQVPTPAPSTVSSYRCSLGRCLPHHTPHTQPTFLPFQPRPCPWYWQQRLRARLLCRGCGPAPHPCPAHMSGFRSTVLSSPSSQSPTPTTDRPARVGKPEGQTHKPVFTLGVTCSTFLLTSRMENTVNWESSVSSFHCINIKRKANAPTSGVPTRPRRRTAGSLGWGWGPLGHTCGTQHTVLPIRPPPQTCSHLPLRRLACATYSSKHASVINVLTTYYNPQIINHKS